MCEVIKIWMNLRKVISLKLNGTESQILGIDAEPIDPIFSRYFFLLIKMLTSRHEISEKAADVWPKDGGEH